jgi:hypothetical protein
MVTKKVGTLDRRKCPTGTDIDVRDSTVIEADRNKPRPVRAPQPHLLDSQDKLFPLIADLAGEALA